MKKISCLSFLLLTANPLNAEYKQIELLWAPDKIHIGELSTTIDDLSNTTFFTLDSPHGFYSIAPIWRCSAAGVEFYGASVDRTIFTGFERYQTAPSGLSFKIDQIHGGSTVPGENVPATIISSKTSYKSVQSASIQSSCPTHWSNPSALIPMPATRLVIPITISRATATPGVHTGTLRAWVGLYENFCNGSLNSCPDGVLGAEWFNHSNQTEIKVPYRVTVTSKCTFNTSQINLSHGKMTPNESQRNVTRPYNLNVSCTGAQQSINVTLRGNDPVSGQTSNFTQCGPGGSCELKFNGLHHYGEVQVNRNTNLAITSTFHPKSGAPIAGAFQGSGILSILVN